MIHGTFTLNGALFQETYTSPHVGNMSIDYNSKPNGSDFRPELIHVHSQLLMDSYLVSFPPLTNMLKFSGFSDLTSCIIKGTLHQGASQTNAGSYYRTTCCSYNLLIRIQRETLTFSRKNIKPILLSDSPSGILSQASHHDSERFSRWAFAHPLKRTSMFQLAIGIN